MARPSLLGRRSSGAALGIATLVATMVLTGAAALAQRSAFGEYAGRYPSDRVGGRTFLEAAREVVQPVIGSERWRRLAGYHVTVPIAAVRDGEFGEALVSWQCRPHDCPNEATVVLSMGGQLIAVCFSDGRRAEWFGPGWRAPAREPQCGSEPAEVFARLRAARARR